MWLLVVCGLCGTQKVLVHPGCELPEDWSQLKERGLNSFLACPIMLAREVVGVLIIADGQLDLFANSR